MAGSKFFPGKTVDLGAAENQVPTLVLSFINCVTLSYLERRRH
jgi:hypothetical protein